MASILYVHLCPLTQFYSWTWASCLFFNRLTLFFFFPLAACGILVPWPGIKPVSLTVETRSPNHWTIREIPDFLSWFHLPKAQFTLFAYKLALSLYLLCLIRDAIIYCLSPWLKECLSSKMMAVPKPTENLWNPSAFALFLHTFLPDSLHTERGYTRNSPRKPSSKPLCYSNPAHSSGCKWTLLPSIIIDLLFDPSSIYSTQSPEYIPSHPVHLCVWAGDYFLESKAHSLL